MSVVLEDVRYKYMPKDFEGMSDLPEDLEAFYKTLEIYKESDLFVDRVEFREAWETLFFSIKHREVEGYLNPALASELRSYLAEVAND